MGLLSIDGPAQNSEAQLEDLAADILVYPLRKTLFQLPTLTIAVFTSFKLYLIKFFFFDNSENFWVKVRVTGSCIVSVSISFLQTRCQATSCLQPVSSENYVLENNTGCFWAKNCLIKIKRLLGKFSKYIKRWLKAWKLITNLLVCKKKTFFLNGKTVFAVKVST